MKHATKIEVTQFEVTAIAAAIADKITAGMVITKVAHINPILTKKRPKAASPRNVLEDRFGILTPLNQNQTLISHSLILPCKIFLPAVTVSDPQPLHLGSP